jgi:hypothetical protein
MRKYKQAYRTQKSGAKVRNIEWHFTYEEWVAWWGADIDKRGNKTDCLVMSRIGDQGPYHPNNVVKRTVGENHSDAHKNGLGWGIGSKHSPESIAKISAANKGRVFTAEHRAKLNVSKQGVPRSPGVREKIRATLLAKRLLA